MALRVLGNLHEFSGRTFKFKQELIRPLSPTVSIPLRLLLEYLDGRIIPESELLDMDLCLGLDNFRITMFLGASLSLDLRGRDDRRL